MLRTADDRIDIEVSGKLDSAEMSDALDALVRESEGIEKGRMLFRVGDYSLPTLGAIKVEFARLPAMLGFIFKFRRCAVLADQGWLKAISELEGALIPGVSIRGFNLEEIAEAEAWLAADS